MIAAHIIPEYVFIVGLIGIIFLAIALIVWFVFYFAFYTSVNNTVDSPADKNSGYNITLYVSSIFGGIGFILSCFLFYGLYLVHTYKPKNLKLGGKNIVKPKRISPLKNIEQYPLDKRKRSIYAPGKTDF